LDALELPADDGHAVLCVRKWTLAGINAAPVVE
jgi:hypothetical protein